MPVRTLVTAELAKLLTVLAHPHRIRIVEELRNQEMDVNSLQAALGVSHSRVSQHLSVMRAARIVAERREGRHVHYRLVQPEIAGWLLEGLRFVEAGLPHAEEIRDAVEKARQLWAANAESAAELALAGATTGKS